MSIRIKRIVPKCIGWVRLGNPFLMAPSLSCLGTFFCLRGCKVFERLFYIVCAVFVCLVFWCGVVYIVRLLIG